MRVFFLAMFIFSSNFVCAKKDDTFRAQFSLYDNFSIHSDICTIKTSQGTISIKISTVDDIKNSSLINSFKYEEKLIIEAIIQEVICRQTYQMTGKEKERLLSFDYQDIVFQLLRLNYLSDQQILSLWEEYKQKGSLVYGIRGGDSVKDNKQQKFIEYLTARIKTLEQDEIMEYRPSGCILQSLPAESAGFNIVVCRDPVSNLYLRMVEGSIVEPGKLFMTIELCK